MTTDENSIDFAGLSDDSDDVEIIEVVGVDDAGTARDEPDEEDSPGTDPDEIVLSLDDEDIVEAPGAEIRAEPGGPDGAEGLALLRLQADYDNLRKRLERERAEFEIQANFSLVGRLLPVLDNFERAMASTRRNGSDQALWQGLEMIYRQLLDELRRDGLSTIDSVGCAFDPKIHDAVATEGDGDGTSATVIEELQRGYTFRGRLLRPAMVKVARVTHEVIESSNGPEGD